MTTDKCIYCGKIVLRCFYKGERLILAIKKEAVATSLTNHKIVDVLKLHSCSIENLKVRNNGNG